MSDQDQSQDLAAQVEAAAAASQPLSLHGGKTKAFYGRPTQGQPCAVAGHRGIVNYEPTELVITARAGTPLSEVTATLAAAGQCLPFEPPGFGAAATLGGTIACNLSGPARPWAGAARDLVLGSKIINGRGEVLRFGGEVMKNVAGYDLSRLMCGALGTLGLLLEVSLKVLPQPEQSITLVQDRDAADALTKLQVWGLRPWPITASCWYDGRLYLRLSGNGGAVSEARAHIGGEVWDGGPVFWQDLREQRLDFFAATWRDQPLWRLALPANAPPAPAAWGACLHEWNGTQRWLRGDLDVGALRDYASQWGGHASLFRASAALRHAGPFQPLTPALRVLHQRLKQAMDPLAIFNPGRLYADW